MKHLKNITYFHWALGVSVVAIIAWAFNSQGAGHTQWVGAVTFSTDGSELVSAAGDDHTAEVLVWRTEDWKRRTKIVVESGRPKWLWYTKQAGMVYLGCRVIGESVTDYKPDEVTLLNVRDGVSVSSYSEAEFGGGIVPLNEQQQFVVYSWNSVDIRSVVDGDRHALFSNVDSEVRSVSSADNEKFLVACDANRVHLWNMTSGERLSSFSASKLPLRYAHVSSDGRFIAAAEEEWGYGAEEFSVHFWDAEEGAEPTGHVTFSRPVTWLRFLTGDKPRLLVVYGKNHADCGVSLYDTSGQLLQELYKGNSEVADVSVSPDRTRLCWVDSESRGRMWDISGDELHQVWEESLIEARSVTFSPDGQQIAAHGYAPEIGIFDAASGKMVARLKGYTSSSVAMYLLTLIPMLVLLGGVQWYRKQAADNRMSVLSAAGRELGWQHTSGALPEGISDFDFFKRRSGGSFEHVLLGRDDNYHTMLAVYSWIQRSGDSSVPMQSLCVIYPQAAAQIPDLLIRPEFLTDKLAEYVGFTDVDFADGPARRRFSDLYLLRTTEPDRMPDIVTESLAQFLCEHEGWNIEVLGGGVLLRWERVKSFSSSRFTMDNADDVIAFVRESEEILRLLVPELRLRPRGD